MASVGNVVTILSVAHLLANAENAAYPVSRNISVISMQDK